MAKIFPLHPEKKNLYENVRGVSYLKRHRVTGIYYVRKFKAGKGELFRSTGTTKKGIAQTKADAMISEWLGKARKATQRMTVAQACEALEAELRQEFEAGQRRAKTWEHDRAYLKVISDLFGTRYVDEFDEETWAEWIRTTGSKMNRTLFDVAKYLSKVLTFGYRKRWITRKPQIRNPDAQAKTGRIYSDDEIAAIIEAADPRTLCQTVLGYECGLRSYEVRCLRIDWLSFRDDGTAILRLPEDFVKANAREILLSEKASQMVQELITGASPFVFPAPSDPGRPETAVYQNRRWRRVCEKAGVGGRNWFRYLRQSFYNKALLEMGLPIQLVSAYGGTSIRTLQKRYLLPDASRTAAVSQAVTIPIREKFVKKGGDEDGSN